MTESVFSFEMKVRDYECDMQGIVNNAVYQHYLETARHEFLESRGVSFAELTQMGTIVVVIRAEIDYLSPLRASELFKVSVVVRQHSRLKLVFEQSITRMVDDAEILTAKIYAAALKDFKKPFFPDELKALL